MSEIRRGRDKIHGAHKDDPQWREYVKLYLDGDKVGPFEPWMVGWLIAEIGRLAKELWSCPECAFTFDAVHVDEMSADYSCPACAELRLGAENTRLQEALITIAERLDDAGCQCDSSDEYVYICNLCTANDALAKRNP